MQLLVSMSTPPDCRYYTGSSSFADITRVSVATEHTPAEVCVQDVYFFRPYNAETDAFSHEFHAKWSKVSCTGSGNSFEIRLFETEDECNDSQIEGSLLVDVGVDVPNCANPLLCEKPKDYFMQRSGFTSNQDIQCDDVPASFNLDQTYDDFTEYNTPYGAEGTWLVKQFAWKVKWTTCQHSNKYICAGNSRIHAHSKSGFSCVNGLDITNTWQNEHTLPGCNEMPIVGDPTLHRTNIQEFGVECDIPSPIVKILFNWCDSDEANNHAQTLKIMAKKTVSAQLNIPEDQLDETYPTWECVGAQGSQPLIIQLNSEVTPERAAETQRKIATIDEDDVLAALQQEYNLNAFARESIIALLL